MEEEEEGSGKEDENPGGKGGRGEGGGVIDKGREGEVSLEPRLGGGACACARLSVEIYSL